MKRPGTLPKPAEVVHEAIVVVLGAVLAAAVIGFFPDVKAWIKARWQ